MDIGRFDRQIRLFGKEGQRLIQEARISVVGAGGLGSHVIQQLAFLGVGSLTIIDPDELEKSNLNRLIGSHHNDPIPGTKKVEIAKRLINSINQSIEIKLIHNELRTEEAFSEIKKSDYVFGCVDNDGSRLILNELCSAFEIPYLDLASGIIKNEKSLEYGGRVFVNFDDNGCLFCYKEILLTEAALEIESSNMRKDREEIYGVSQNYLDETGPSVVSIDGVVSSLAVTEFLVMITRLREPKRLIRYRADLRRFTKSKDKPLPNCLYCKSIRGKRNKTNVDRYLLKSN